MSGYFEFIADHGDGHSASVRIPADSSLTETVEAFQQFLLAAGFTLEPGYHIDLVEDEK